MAARTVVSLLLVASVLGSGTAGGVDQAYFESEQVVYYVAGGAYNGSALARGPSTDGGDRLPFIGCSYLQIRPETGNGVVRVLGLLNNITFVEIQFEYFRGPQEGVPQLAFEFPIDGSLDNPEPQHPLVEADLVTWGAATVRIDGNQYPDPATGNNDTRAMVMLTPEGFREEPTGATGEPEDGD